MRLKKCVLLAPFFSVADRPPVAQGDLPVFKRFCGGCLLTARRAMWILWLQTADRRNGPSRGEKLALGSLPCASGGQPSAKHWSATREEASSPGVLNGMPIDRGARPDRGHSPERISGPPGALELFSRRAIRASASSLRATPLGRARLRRLAANPAESRAFR